MKPMRSIRAEGSKLTFAPGDLALVCPSCNRPYAKLPFHPDGTPIRSLNEPLVTYCDHRLCKTERLLVMATVIFDEIAA